ncbi:MAG TPA: alpha/beta hydrolase [Caulobacteraceae bacterium]|jgi:pimeloyl-ACP methyl ester carboxylesterase|nr:alpha/beta hydrolase [Caulobacteraceae bacterium]
MGLWLGHTGLAIGYLVLALIAVGVFWQTVAERRDASRYPAPGRLIDLGGRRLHLRFEGAGSGPTVVMIAGGGTPSVVSYDLQDRIAAFAKVCSYDRPGLGWSAPARRPLSLDDHIDDLHGLLEKAGVAGPLVLVPESFGGLIALGYAQRYPQAVAGTVFVDSVEPEAWFEAMKTVSPFRSRLTRVLLEIGWRVGAVRALVAVLSPPWTANLPALIQGQLRAVYSRAAPGLTEALTVYEHTPEARRPRSAPGLLGDLPVMVIRHGKTARQMEAPFEATWPAAQARLASLSANSEVIVADGAGHAVAQERPDLVAAAVQDLMARLLAAT